MSRVPNEFICVHAGMDRASCLVHWGAWIPLETDYVEEVAEIRRGGRTVGQVTHLKSSGNPALLRECFRQMILLCIGLNLTDLVAAVPPDAVANYRRFYFTIEVRPPSDGGASTWSLARDESGNLLPVRVVRLAIDKVPEDVLKRFLEAT
jgi:hypothetical protein